jgi:hypothetical protein
MISSGSVPAPDPDYIQQFNKNSIKPCLFTVRSSIVSLRNLASHFDFLILFYVCIHFMFKMLEPDPNPVPEPDTEPECIPVPVPLRHKSETGLQFVSHIQQ